MIPGTIEDWKKALKESVSGIERCICADVLILRGVAIERRDGQNWYPEHRQLICSNVEYRVKPTARPWIAEDAKKHVGFAWRLGPSDSKPGLISADSYPSAVRWDGREYAAPIPGTDPASWDWKKCEVVE